MSLRLIIPSICAVLVGAATPAIAATPAPPAEAVDTCIRYGEREHPDRDWTCVGGTFTLLTARADGSLGPAEVRSTLGPRETSGNEYGVRREAGRLAERIDDYHANSTETIVAFLDRKKYTVSFNFKIGLHDHSGNVAMRWSSAYPVSLTYSLRIRRDVTLAFDETVYAYEEHLYGSSVPAKSYTRTEGQNGIGHKRLPADGKRYFWDAWNLHLRIDGTAVSTAGSVQSDRATCYKTTSCKFKKGDT
ncbi:hypothetical protein ACFXB3_40005 [Streptomyces sp. NPDC059447]|uniref:hypothetical protein n=1 Tax=Streptomyces sp. NPDC059447 TaxID=3346834 RepID=UPI0036CB5B9E